MAEIRIPDIGDAENVEVIELCVAPGDSVGPDDAILVIESDKASMEVPAGIAGTLEALLVGIGDAVEAGQPIARLGTPDERAASDPGAESVALEAESAPSLRTPRTQPVEEPVVGDAQTPDEPTLGDAQPPARNEIVVSVPDIGDAQQVVVVEVAIGPGDRVEAKGLAVVIESDKATMEIPAGVAGEVAQVHVAEGDPVAEGTRLFTLATEGAAAPQGVAAPATDDAESPARRPPRGESPPLAPAKPPGSEIREEKSPGARVYAGPATRRLARELGVRLEQVNGTGARGRIVKDDVKLFVKQALTTPQAPGAPGGAGIPPIPAVDFERFGPVETMPLTRTRAAGARNLHASWLNIAHVTQHDEADVTELEAFRESLKPEAAERGVNLTPLPFIVKACCYALKKFPTFNASLDSGAGNYLLKRYCNIGFAVDSEQGLVVPVLKDADRKGIWELAEEIADLAARVRDKRLAMDDVQGGTFSISSLGALGGTGFTPIVNAPEVAILGVAKLTTKPVWDGSQFQPRKMLPLSLSYDHRAINGAEAGRFVGHLVELLNDVRRLSL